MGKMSDDYQYTTHISDEQVAQAAAFFSAHYGVWGQAAVENMSSKVKAGARVRISPTLLRQKILSPAGENIFISFARADKLIGILFASCWTHQNKSMVWVTQLCVHSEHRNEGIAKGLLSALKSKTGSVYAAGILSSHPFSISALARVFGEGIEKVDLNVMKTEASGIMKSCPVGYVRDADLRGSLLEDGKEESVHDGEICCADTKFWVDHGEPDEALRILGEKGVRWPLGQLPEGCEYLSLVRPNNTTEI